jgi:hypothetical protein
LRLKLMENLAGGQIKFIIVFVLSAFGKDEVLALDVSGRLLLLLLEVQRVESSVVEGRVLRVEVL